MDKSRLVGAAIIAFGLVIGGFLAGGRYEVVAGYGNTTTRLDRWTGEVEMCVADTRSPNCGWIVSRYSGTGTPPCRDGAAECDPWEREWGAQVPEEGSIVMRNGEVYSPPSQD